jgi:hypothetical protein
VSSIIKVDYTCSEGHSACKAASQKESGQSQALPLGCEQHSPSIPTAPLVSEEQLIRRISYSF